MKVFNTIYISILIGIVGFLSMAFFIGSLENKIELENDLLFSFIGRFFGFSVLGFIGTSILLFLNFLIKKINPSNKINLNRLVITSSILIILMSLIGTSVFFFL